MHDHHHSHAHPARADHADSSPAGLRAAVFGASDGLVSNAALVLGVAAGGGGADAVLLAGIAGLFAGALSMAAGEWISVQSEREAREQELAMEAAHLDRYPEAEHEHMVEILTGAGLSEEVAGRVAQELDQRPVSRLEFHARMELGIDPEDLGSPGLAAGVSFASFGLGAALPLLPWWLSAPAPLGLSILASALGLFVVGAATSRFTHRTWRYAGARQLAFGVAAAAITMAIGGLVGVSV